MNQSVTASFKQAFESALPLTSSPLVQCITNEITVESMANALLYIDAKPVMADAVQEFPEFLPKIMPYCLTWDISRQNVKRVC